jgi:ubiquinone/menaquinone biosynthesis C-methylase UbiE
LLLEKYRRSLRALGHPVSGDVAITLCGGSGMDAELLARDGAAVIATDISLGAARRTRERARRSGLVILAVVADAERLPLADRSVDVAYVHDGLHHLEQPLAGVEEMTRVTRRGVSITEPARALGTGVAVRFGLALEVEESGNRVARFTPGELSENLERHGYEAITAERYLMYYRHHPGRAVAALSRSRLFPLFRRGFLGLNSVVGRWGNKLTVQAVRAAAE